MPDTKNEWYWHPSKSNGIAKSLVRFYSCRGLRSIINLSQVLLYCTMDLLNSDFDASEFERAGLCRALLHRIGLSGAEATPHLQSHVQTVWAAGSSLATGQLLHGGGGYEPIVIVRVRRCELQGFFTMSAAIARGRLRKAQALERFRLRFSAAGDLATDGSSDLCSNHLLALLDGVGAFQSRTSSACDRLGCKVGTVPSSPNSRGANQIGLLALLVRTISALTTFAR
jgi:hypothetical protein